MQSDLLYYTLLYFSRIKALVTRLAYWDFRSFYRGGLCIFMLLLLFCTWPTVSEYSQSYQIRYYASYIGATLFSYVAMDICLQYSFRNVVGVLLGSILIPVIMGRAFWRCATANVDSFLAVSLFLSVGLVILLWFYKQNWAMYWTMARQNGLASVIRFFIKGVRRNRNLSRERKQWQNNAEKQKYPFSWLSPDLWWTYSYEERVDYMQKTIAYEIQSLNLEEPLSVQACSLGRTPYLNFECELDSRSQRITWEEDVVHFFQPQEILLEVLHVIRVYQWYVTLTPDEQMLISEEQANTDDITIIFEKSELARLLYQKLNGVNWSLAYDILTDRYIKAKADWYCGF